MNGFRVWVWVLALGLVTGTPALRGQEAAVKNNAPAKAAKKAEKPAAAPAKTDAEKKADELAARYKLTDDQKAKIAALLKVQTDETQKVQAANTEKAKALKEQLDLASGELKKLQASELEMKAAQARALDELITKDQKIAAIADDLLKRAAARYLPFLSDDLKSQLATAARAAAEKTLAAAAEADVRKRRELEQAATAELYAAVAKIVTPDVRRKVETEELYNTIAASLRNVKLSDEQVQKVKSLCTAAVDERTAWTLEQEQATQKANDLRTKLRTRPMEVIRKAVTDTLLTEDQKKVMEGKTKAEPKKAAPAEAAAPAAAQPPVAAPAPDAPRKRK